MNKLLLADLSMSELKKLIENAVKYHQSGHLDQAQNLYRSILKSDPGNAFVLHSLGLLAYQKGQCNEALELTTHAVTANARCAEFHNTLGVIYESLDQPDRALQSYHRAIALKPDYAEAYNNIAVALESCSKTQQAIESCEKAITLKPQYAQAHYTMGYILQMQRRFAEAVDCYKKAINFKPQYVEAHNHLAIALTEQHLYDQAHEYYTRALELAPDYAEVHNNLGILYKLRGESGNAISCYKRALGLEPDFTEAYYNLANVQKDQELYDESMANCEKAISLNPDYAEAYNVLGIILAEKGRNTEAIDKYRHAIQLKPNEAEFYNNLGIALNNEIRFEEARSCYRRALEIEPDFAQVYYNLANLQKEQGNCDQAIQNFKRAVSLKPDYPDAHWNLSLAYLLNGEYTKGWETYKWRRDPDLKIITDFHSSGKPRWDGSSFKGKTLFVHFEQGIGDNIQFIRYLPMVKTRGGTVVFETFGSLAGLFMGLPYIDRLVGFSPDRKAPLDFDCYTSLLELPNIFGTTVETIPDNVPYLYADPVKAKYWRNRLHGQEFKVGIVWAGSPEHGNDHNRSCTLEHFLPLTQIAGIRIYSLQKGPATRQLQEFANQATITDIATEFEDFSDTAAAVQNLDLVISVDTSVLHLAGAMGKPTWALIPFAAEWRWMLQRNDSPWYPTMKLFRQNKWGDWPGVLDSIAENLTLIAKEHRQTDYTIKSMATKALPQQRFDSSFSTFHGLSQ